jgi:hypothetical protein
MERFFDGTDQENSKTQGKGQSRKIFKKEKNGGKKKIIFFILFYFIFMYIEVPILVCSPLVRNAFVRPSIRRTHSYGKLPYNISSSISFIPSPEKPGRIFNLQHIILRVFLTFRNVEILKECSFQRNQIFLRENRESCKIF